MKKILAYAVIGAFVCVFLFVMVGLPLYAAKEQFGGWFAGIRFYLESMAAIACLIAALTWAMGKVGL